MGKNALRIRPARAVLAGAVLAVLPMASFAFVSVGVSITVAPPALPVYVQPACPGVGYIWTPGYWAWGDDDYYWVPGTWVLAPSVGLLWTPGYWGWGDGVYLWHPGYWGPHVGFYGGINYGYGYTGVGFYGGYWRGGAFYYNRAYSNLGGLHVTNVYNNTVVNNITVNRVSFNGGENGIHARPNAHELAAEHEHHVDFTPVQREHEHMAFGDRDLRASVNGGKPRIAATARPTSFTGRGVVAARAAGAPYHAPEHGGGGHGPASAGHGPEMHAGGPARSVEPHGGVAREATMRGDRPPGATGSGSAAIHGGTGGGSGRTPEMHAGDRGAPGVGRGSDAHVGGPVHEAPHMAVAHNDRPPGASGGSSAMSPHMNQANQMRSERSAPEMRPQAHMDAPRPQAHFDAPRPQAHFDTPRPQAHFDSPRPQAHFDAPRPQAHFDAPRPQAQPHMEAPRPQAAPHMEARPPQAEMRRGGGEPPHGQAGPRPQMRGGEQNHGRR